MILLDSRDNALRLFQHPTAPMKTNHPSRFVYFFQNPHLPADFLPTFCPLEDFLADKCLQHLCSSTLAPIQKARELRRDLERENENLTPLLALPSMAYDQHLHLLRVALNPHLTLVVENQSYQILNCPLPQPHKPFPFFDSKHALPTLRPDNEDILPDTHSLPPPFPPCVLFRDANKQQKLLRELAQILDIQDPSQFALLLCWLLAAMLPPSPCPPLILCGPEGAGKSALAALIQVLIEPKELCWFRPLDDNLLRYWSHFCLVLCEDNMPPLFPHELLIRAYHLFPLFQNPSHPTPRFILTTQHEHPVRGFDENTLKHLALCLHLTPVPQEKQIPLRARMNRLFQIRSQVFALLCATLALAVFPQNDPFPSVWELQNQATPLIPLTPLILQPIAKTALPFLKFSQNFVQNVLSFLSLEEVPNDQQIAY